MSTEAKIVTLKDKDGEIIAPRTTTEAISDFPSVDTTPTSGSNNLITSGGVATALNGKANTIHTHSYNSILEKPSSFVPSAHKNTHTSGGSDAITPTSIGAAPAYSYGTTDLTAGASPLATGELYFVYE